MKQCLEWVLDQVIQQQFLYFYPSLVKSDYLGKHANYVSTVLWPLAKNNHCSVHQCAQKIMTAESFARLLLDVHFVTPGYLNFCWRTQYYVQMMQQLLLLSHMTGMKQGHVGQFNRACLLEFGLLAWLNQAEFKVPKFKMVAELEWLLRVYQRNHRVLSQLSETSDSVVENFIFLSWTPSEQRCIRHLMYFEEYLVCTIEQQSSSILLEYLKNLARFIQSLYNEVTIMGTDTQKNNALIHLLRASQEVFIYGFDLIGIEL